MRRWFLFSIIPLAIAAMAVACGGSSSDTSGDVSGTSASDHTASPASSATAVSPAHGKSLSAREAVSLAYTALTADWKPTARLAFVGRYSKFCNVDCSPFDVEEDPGIGSNGRQAHWVVIFADETASTADVFYVEEGEAKLVKSDIAMIRPDELFALEGWVDSTEIQFITSKPVGLELRTSDLFEDVDAELGRYPLLWLAEKSFARFDVYDAETGQYIKSR